MAILDEFKPEQARTLFGSADTRKSRTIIKQQEVRVGNPVRIKPSDGAGQHEGGGHEMRVRPIQKDGRIVGVITECGCGEAVRILFEFEEAAER